MILNQFTVRLCSTYVLRTPDCQEPKREEVQCKKAAKMQCSKMQGCPLQTTSSRQNTTLNICRNPETISEENWKRFLQKFEKVCAPRSQLHVSPTTSALSHKMSLWNKLFNLKTLFLLVEVLFTFDHWRRLTQPGEQGEFPKKAMSWAGVQTPENLLIFLQLI